MLIPPKEVIAEELEFDERERKFYNDLQARGMEVIEELKNSKGGLQRNYMCLLTMLLRLRQGISSRFQLSIATDHIELLRGKVEMDNDALDKPVIADKEEDDLVALMGGLGIEAKCSICFTVYFLVLRI